MTPDWAAVWGGVALDAAAKSVPLFLLAWVAAWGASGAAQRHRIWLLFLGGLLVLPLLSVTVPRWQVPLPQLPAATGRPGPSGAGATGEAFPGATPGTGAPWKVRPTDRGVDVGVNSRDYTSPLASFLIGVWSLGALVVFGRAILSIAAVRRLRRASHAEAPPIVTNAAREAAARLGLRRVPAVRLGLPGAPVVAPLTWGFLRPVLLLPAEAAEWPEERLRAVLLHECAHVARGDWAVQGVAAVACALYWFHPGMWHAAARLRAEAERACDDQVLGAGFRPADYATILLDILRALRAPLTAPLGTTMTSAMNPFDRSQIEERLNAILDDGVDRRPACRSWRLRTGVVALGLVALLAAGGYGTATTRAPSVPLTPPAPHATPAAVAPAARRPPAAEAEPRASVAAPEEPAAAAAYAAPAAPRRPSREQPADESARRSEAALQSLRAQLNQLLAQRAVLQAKAEAASRRATGNVSLLQKELDLLDNRLAALRVEAVIRPERQQVSGRLHQLVDERAQLADYSSTSTRTADIDRRIALERERLAQAERETADQRAETIGRLERRRRELLAEIQADAESQGDESSKLQQQLDDLNRQIAEQQEQIQNARAEEQRRLRNLHQQRMERFNEQQRKVNEQRERAKAQAEAARRAQTDASAEMRRTLERQKRLQQRDLRILEEQLRTTQPAKPGAPRKPADP